MQQVLEYFKALNDGKVIEAALILLLLGLPFALLVWALVRHQHHQMELHYCPKCAKARPYVHGSTCPHCGAPMQHRPWP
jgi:hypothetical protein